MLTPVVNIIIGNLKFKGCKSFEVDKHVDNLSVKGFVELPLRAVMSNKDSKKVLIIDDKIKQGDSISIEAGYKEHDIHKIFKGYITNIDVSNSVKIKIEDSLYLLRKKPIIIEKENIQLKDVCTEILKDTGLKLSDKTPKLKIDVFKYKGNCAGALAKLKENLKLTCYFDDDKLYAGGEQMNMKESINATFGVNILKNNTSYQYADANPVQVVVIGKKENGEEVKIVEGIEGGSKMTFYKYNVTDEESLKTIAKEQLQKYTYNGFKGSLGMWFIPFCELGSSVTYKNKNYKQETEGKYFVKGIKYRFSTSEGLKQNIQLGTKL